MLFPIFQLHDQVIRPPYVHIVKENLRNHLVPAQSYHILPTVGTQRQADDSIRNAMSLECALSASAMLHKKTVFSNHDRVNAAYRQKSFIPSSQPC